jgi:hypothetical protein
MKTTTEQREQAIEYVRQTVCEAHMAAKKTFGGGYKKAVRPACEELRRLMVGTGLDAVSVGAMLVADLNSRNLNWIQKAITLAAIYEVDQEESLTRN